MTKLLEKALEKVRTLSDEEQDALAAFLLSLADSDASIVPLDERTRAAMREGLAQAERGEFVSDEELAAANKHHGI